ncbi:MAG: flagellar basal body rod C-terminal domain-containing protein, partial [Pygmaiobacter massiliensis]|nr:flagellar basal body rod C-terminal domain-containing protein [Pygmaiobacter massiliensis]
SVGSADAKLAGLEALSSILDEVGKGDGSGVIEKQFNDLITQLQNLNTQGTGQAEFDALVRSSAATLAKLFNSYSSKLDDVTQNQITSLKQEITAVNDLLKNIRDLNASIRRSDIHGDNALELRDQRNLLIDELSQYMKIDVSYGTEDIGNGQTVEKLIIKLAGANPNPGADRTDKATLIDGIYGTQLSFKQEPTANPAFDNTKPASDTNPAYLKADGSPTNVLADAEMKDSANYDLVLGQLTDARGKIHANADGTLSTAVNLGDNDLYGSLQSLREILTEKGEYSTTAEIAADPNAATKRGIPYYRNALDALARQFATALNGANTLSDDVIYQKDAGGNFLLDGDGKKILKPSYANYKGGNLFSNSGTGNDASNITAANISISLDWSKGDVHILASKAENATSQDNSNITHIIALMDSKLEYRPSDVAAGAGNTVSFKGTFQEMLTNIGATLANDKKTTATMLTNYVASATELNTSRDSVSGVDLNDEAASLMQYQKSYAAACRLMTTLDEALDKLINGTGVVGR